MIDFLQKQNKYTKKPVGIHLGLDLYIYLSQHQSACLPYNPCLISTQAQKY